MTPQERLHAAESGQLSLGEMLRWPARRPHEVPLVNGEFSSSPLAADSEDSPPHPHAVWDGECTPVPQSRDMSRTPAVATDTSQAPR